MLFVILFSPSDPRLSENSLFEQPRRALRALASHRDYLQELLTAGKLVSAGPFLDGSGGLAIVEVDTPDEAVGVLSNDPAITSGLFTARVLSWRAEFLRTDLCDTFQVGPAPLLRTVHEPDHD